MSQHPGSLAMCVDKSAAQLVNYQNQYVPKRRPLPFSSIVDLTRPTNAPSCNRPPHELESSTRNSCFRTNLSQPCMVDSNPYVTMAERSLASTCTSTSDLADVRCARPAQPLWQLLQGGRAPNLAQLASIASVMQGALRDRVLPELRRCTFYLWEESWRTSLKAWRLSKPSPN